jgi:hypothetical protein
MMKRIFSFIVIGLAAASLAADKPKGAWQRDWDRRSFCTTMTVLAYNAGADGKTTDDELIEIAKAGFRILEPDDSKAQLIAEMRSEGAARVVFVAHDYGTSFLGYAFSFSQRGYFEKLVVVPSQ